MIGRDRIVIRGRTTTADGDPVEKAVWGSVVTDQLDGTSAPFGPPAPFGRGAVTHYRLIFPPSLDLSNVQVITVSFRNRTAVKLGTPVVPVYDGRGRVHHWEAVVRSS